jgi:hypothetical protein
VSAAINVPRSVVGWSVGSRTDRGCRFGSRKSLQVLSWLQQQRSRFAFQSMFRREYPEGDTVSWNMFGGNDCDA